MIWLVGKPTSMMLRTCSSTAPGDDPQPLGSGTKIFGLRAALLAVVLLACAAGTTTAFADDPILTKSPVPTAPAAGPGPCDGVPDFFLCSCQLAWYGVRFYGVVDVGGGYQTHGAPWDPNFPQGSSYLVQKMNRESMWTLAPNAMSCSSLGIQVNEPIRSRLALRRPDRSRLRSLFAATRQWPGIDCRQQRRAARRADRQ